MNDTWFAISELALGLAGFAGVSAAFSGRERAFRPIERIRFLSVLQTSGNTLVGTLALVTLDAAAVSEPVALRLVALLGLAAVAFVYAPQMPAVYRGAAQSDSSSEPWAVRLTLAYLVALTVFYGAQLFRADVAWPVLGAFSLQIAFGVWMFARFLTRPN
ncbi:MAG: hypothetical protein NXI30_17755 [bacterium]|nr:hypothetical protein [bacterium]